MWKEILKAPVRTRNEVFFHDKPKKYRSKFLDSGEEFEILDDVQSRITGSQFEGLRAWESEDKMARGTFRREAISKKGPLWHIDAFSVNKKLMNQGKGEEYLREMVNDLKEIEDLKIYGQPVHRAVSFWKRMKRKGIVDFVLPPINMYKDVSGGSILRPPSRDLTRRS
jgi:hypothetical protein